MNTNKNVFLVMGTPASGKTFSLMFLKDQDRVVYLNTDLKEVTFPHGFKLELQVPSPYDVLPYIDQIEENDDVDVVVLDTLTYLFMMFENQIIKTAEDTREAWGSYADFYQTLMNKIKAGTKSYIILAHEGEKYDKKNMVNDVSVPLKGATGRLGCEGDYTNILQARTITIGEAKENPNSLLTLSEEEINDGIKHVFVTRKTGDTVGHKIRSSWKLWNRDELYIDNNCQNVLDRLQEYYSPKQQTKTETK